MGTTYGDITMREMNRLYDEIKNDPIYNRFRKPGINMVRGRGSNNPRVIFIGEAPGRAENTKQQPFIGPAGDSLKLLMSLVRIDPREVYYTNVIKYWMGSDSEAPSDDLLTYSATYIRREVELLANNRTIVGLCGRSALRAIFPEVHGVSQYHGASMDFNNITYVPLYHPSVLTHRPHMKSTILKGYTLVRNLVDSI